MRRFLVSSKVQPRKIPSRPSLPAARRVKKKSPRARSRVTGLENSFASTNHRHRSYYTLSRFPLSRFSRLLSLVHKHHTVRWCPCLSDFLTFSNSCGGNSNVSRPTHLRRIRPCFSSVRVRASSLDPTDRILPIDRNFQSSAGYLQHRRGFATRNRDARADVARDPLTP